MVRGLRIVLPLVVISAGVFAQAAAGDFAGTDPTANYAPPKVLPSVCVAAPMGAACVDAGVYYLDKARASLGQPDYKLPADFTSLTPAEQMFVLTNLDRIQYGLPPVGGLTDALSQDSLTSGVNAEADPTPSDTSTLDTWTANWAAGYANAALAYEGWMFDDGVGSPNVLCTQNNQTGCWGHRHDILTLFPQGDVLAMGAAAAPGPSLGEGYAMLLVSGFPNDGQGDPFYDPAFTYTWAQAQADGAGTNAYDPGVPKPGCRVPSVVGKTAAAAKRAVSGAHCGTAKLTRKYSQYKIGLVYRQKPAAGTLPKPGVTVRLLVSKGPRR